MEIEKERTSIKPGTYVYAIHGRYVGRVEAANGYLLRVRGDGARTPVYYVPMAAVAGELPGGREIFLNCSIDELPTMGWMHPPHGAAAH